MLLICSMFNKPTSEGFSFIQVLIIIGVVAVIMIGMMLLFHFSKNNVIKKESKLVATYLAREQLESIVGDKVHFGYEYIDNKNYLDNRNAIVADHLYRRLVNIYEVSKGDLVSPEHGSGYKRIDVSVMWGLSVDEMVELSTVLTDY